MNLVTVTAKDCNVNETLVKQIIDKYLENVILTCALTGHVQTILGTFLIKDGKLVLTKQNDAVLSLLNADITTEDIQNAIEDALENHNGWLGN